MNFITFIVILALAAVWFLMANMLYRRLEERHSELYRKMGSPSLFLRNTMASSFETALFIFRRKHKGLNDRYLSRLSDLMFAYLVGYVAIVMVVGLFLDFSVKA